MVEQVGYVARVHPLPPGQKREDVNERWMAIEEYSMNKLHPASRHNSGYLQAALDNSDAGGLPRIESAGTAGKMLALQVRAAGITHVLELGTLGGYGAIWIASMNPGCKVTTIEFDKKHYDVAKQNIKNAGLENQIEQFHGAGLDILPKLAEEVKAGTRPEFGMVYLDADKMNNWNYMQLAAPMTKINGLFYVDNMNVDARLLDEEWQEYTMIKAARNVIENVSKDPRFDAVLLQTINANVDGYLLALLVSK